MWLSGRALASHVRGPGFDPRHLQRNNYFVQFNCYFKCDGLFDNNNKKKTCRNISYNNGNRLLKNYIDLFLRNYLYLNYFEY